MFRGLPDSRVDEDAWRALVRACAVYSVAVCVGGTSAIVAAALGASALMSLALMGAIVICGAAVAVVMVHRAGRRPGGQPSGTTMLEQRLSARYGVPVQRVAWHVWRINGELVEATFDTSTGHLSSGGRELQL